MRDADGGVEIETEPVPGSPDGRVRVSLRIRDGRFYRLVSFKLTAEERKIFAEELLKY